MARAAPQSQPYNRQSSASSRHSRQTSSSSVQSSSDLATSASSASHAGGAGGVGGGGGGSAGGGNTSKSNHGRNKAKNNTNKPYATKFLEYASTLPLLLAIPLIFLHFVYTVLKILLLRGYFLGRAPDDEEEEDENENEEEEEEAENEDSRSASSTAAANNNAAEDGEDEGNEPDLNAALSGLSRGENCDEDGAEYLTVKASPALATLLDDALYRAYQAELVPTVGAASRLLAEFIEMKEAAALVYRECRWAVGVPMSGGLETLNLNLDELGLDGGNNHGARSNVQKGVAIGTVRNGAFFGGGVIADANGNPYFPPTDAPNTEYRRGGSGDSSASVSGNNNPASASDAAATERLHSEEMNRWNEFDTIQDFARQCYLGANEAIQRLTTDRLAESANLTLKDSMHFASKNDNAGGGANEKIQSASGVAGQKVDVTLQHAPSQGDPLASDLPSVSSSPADDGIGRCYHPQPRRNCWESPRLYCPDYYWADDAIGGCQRLLKTLSKHRFVCLVSANGWERYYCTMDNTHKNKKMVLDGELSPDNAANVQFQSIKKKDRQLLKPPTYASTTPHVFPSLEAVHSLQYLVSHLLPTSIPSRLNQFRAAVESNAVVSKRLYLVKCEYRAPMRALWESYGNLNAAPKLELVERYLGEYHGVKKVGEKVLGGEGGGSAAEGTNAAETASGGGGDGASVSSGSSKGTGSLRRKSSVEGAKKSAIQQQREKLEKLLAEKYWKHPAFIEALQLERCCERMELEMSQMLLPLANLATEIMNEWKGRLRAVTVIGHPSEKDEEENDVRYGDNEDESGNKEGQEDMVRVLLGWRDVPFMRELLRRLKSILRRKPDLDESTGIRPLLLDLQGVPRHKQDPLDSSIEMPFFPPLNKPSFLERLMGTEKQTKENSLTSLENDQWYHLEKFLSEIRKLLELLTLPNIPFLVEDRMTGSNKGDKNSLLDIIEQCKEVWDEEMFRAQYMDWFDMVKRQQELNEGGGANTTHVDNNDDSAKQEALSNLSLSELSETIREAEIELSIAMASKDQLERVHKRLEALRADKVARYKVLAHIVFDVGYRELNDGIVVDPPSEEDVTVEFPKLLSVPGVFGDQLTMSGEELPVG